MVLQELIESEAVVEVIGDGSCLTRSSPPAPPATTYVAVASNGPGRGDHSRDRTRSHRDPRPEGHPRRPARHGLSPRRQAVKTTRWRQDTRTGKIGRETVYVIASLTTPADLTRLLREHWPVEVC